MAGFSDHWTFAFGVLGNIISFFVFLSPLPTFYNIYKKKSTEGYQSIPYVVALFSAMLWIYYAFLKTNTTLLVTINTFGCFIETLYVGFYLFYAPKKARVQTIKLLLLLVVGGFGAIILITQFLFKGAIRAQIVGWICLVFSLCVFVAPLCIVRQVIKTKSVEYMPFLLSVFLTLSAVMWFFYGLLLKDFNIAIPNVLGFIFGILQMILYVMPTFYKMYKKKSTEGYQSIPYIVALFSAMLWIYYAFLKTNTTLLITINTFGCFVEIMYIGFYLFYASKEARVQTVKLLLLLVVGGFGAIVLVSQFLFEGAVRVQVVGCICLICSLCVFVAPLCIVRQVIKTKSVEYMPFLLSVFLTLSAVMWFFYGILLEDFNIAIPNVLGFIFGILQMVLYVMYYNKKEEEPTFYNIYKKKSTEGYQSIPYVVALCSAMILIYYVILLGGLVEVIIINAIGVFIETIYIIFYIFYAPKKAKAPNILGFTLGVIQMVLYVVYKKYKKEDNVIKEQKLSELLQNHVIILDDGKKLPQLTQEQIIDIWKLGTLIYSEKLNASAADVDNNRPKLAN
uniref:Bidirectional sugar transporter SWEET n=1 Tax=Solanum lycopersicum TaxID=4081 RepID=A0A3Q7H285_SOLLC